jgi:formate dehydrogenase major subunit
VADRLAQDALAAVDKLLADRPQHIGQDFSEATRRLTALREHCIARWRETKSEVDRRRLERVNAALSVIIGGQFPLGSVQWDSIECVRRDLGQLARTP